ncbi:CMD domain protein [Roseomonas sp. CCTCC AB2023176]|uniref:CMD domain protein n=1 Tax=Roseomonas sp. CCTCC AB2023176 TaxID=3342640 RepID=UPI0035DC8F36
MNEPEDLIDDLLGMAPGSPLDALRRQRPEARRHAQGAYRELLMPDDPGNVSHAERAALALRVALREGDADLAARYRALLTNADAEETLMLAEDLSGDPMEGRLPVLLRYADVVAARPEATTQADLDTLRGMGLTPRDVVAITQLIAFVPYQVRLLAGLRALMQEAAA